MIDGEPQKRKTNCCLEHERVDNQYHSPLKRIVKMSENHSPIPMKGASGGRRGRVLETKPGGARVRGGDWRRAMLGSGCALSTGANECWPRSEWKQHVRAAVQVNERFGWTKRWFGWHFCGAWQERCVWWWIGSKNNPRDEIRLELCNCRMGAPEAPSWPNLSQVGHPRKIVDKREKGRLLYL